MAMYNGSPTIEGSKCLKGSRPVYDIEQTAASSDLTSENYKPSNDSGRPINRREQKKLLNLLHKQQEQQTELLQELCRLRKKEAPVKDYPELNNAHEKHKRRMVEQGMEKTRKDKRIPHEKFQCVPPLQWQTQMLCEQHHPSEQMEDKSLFSKPQKGNDKALNDPSLTLDSGRTRSHDKNRYKPHDQAEDIENVIHSNIRDTLRDFKSHNKYSYFFEEDHLIREQQGINKTLQQRLQDQQISKQLDDQNKTLDLQAESLAAQLLQYHHYNQKHQQEDYGRVRRKRYSPHRRPVYDNSKCEGDKEPSGLLYSLNSITPPDTYQITPENRKKMSPSGECEQRTSGGRRSQVEDLDNSTPFPAWNQVDELAASDLDFPFMKITKNCKTLPCFQYQEDEHLETSQPPRPVLLDQRKDAAYSRTHKNRQYHPAMSRRPHRYSEGYLVDFSKDTMRQTPCRSTSELCIQPCVEKHCQHQKQRHWNHEQDRKEPLQSHSFLRLWDWQELPLSFGVSKGLLETKEPNSHYCKGEERTSDSLQYDNTVYLDEEAMGKKEYNQSLQPMCAWYPLSHTLNSVEDDSCVSEANAETVVRNTGRCLTKQPAPAIQAERIPVCPETCETEAYQNEIPEKDCFETVPQRTKCTPPKPQPCFQSEAAQTTSSGDFLCDKDCGPQTPAPVAAARTEGRQSTPRPKKRIRQDQLRPANVQASLVQRVSLRDQHINLKKNKALPEERSPSRGKKTKDTSLPRAAVSRSIYLQTNKDQRSLSPGVAPPAGKTSSLNRIPVRRTMIAGNKHKNSRRRRSKGSCSKGRNSPATASKIPLGMRKRDNSRSGAESISAPKKARRCNSSDNFDSWTVRRHPQVTSKVNHLLRGSAHKAGEKHFHFGLAYPQKREMSEFHGKQAKARADSLQTYEIHTNVRDKVATTKSKDALIRLYHLPHRLQCLNKKEIGAFQSMSMPSVCIERGTYLKDHNVLTNVENCSEQLRPVQLKAADNKSAGTCAHVESSLIAKTNSAQSQSVSTGHASSLRASAANGVVCINYASTDKARKSPTFNFKFGRKCKSNVADFKPVPSPESCNNPNSLTTKPSSGQDISARNASSSAESWIKRREASALAHKLSAESQSTSVDSISNSTNSKRKADGDTDLSISVKEKARLAPPASPGALGFSLNSAQYRSVGKDNTGSDGKQSRETAPNSTDDNTLSDPVRPAKRSAFWRPWVARSVLVAPLVVALGFTFGAPWVDVCIFPTSGVTETLSHLEDLAEHFNNLVNNTLSLKDK
ncbi:hypothetical protein EGW08_022028 [Elysia chlorotica]|uniref:Uncharacterized protein n=1 Tax=Elysia chlorotica TaxID=188477 RepID=A0A433SM32_ELYCH|nr:hypothetical protein EGW08_022028 [Elysia chlorotica]